MTLLLQWWWSYPETELMDKEFFLNLDTSKKLLYIPTAMIWSFTYEECYSYISGIVSALWISLVIDSCPDLDKLHDISISEYAWVYIWWGNTFKLLYEIRKSWVDKKLINFLNEWWLICWGSAWAILFGNNINTSPDANITNIKNVEWLNLVRNYSIRCHYQPKEEKQIVEYVKYHQCPVIALTERSGIKIVEDKIMSIGIDDVIVFSDHNKKIFRIWDYI